MNRALAGILAGMALSIAGAVPLEAARPPFRQCSPSGYNCTLLITLDKQGKLTVDGDPNLPY